MAVLMNPDFRHCYKQETARGEMKDCRIRETR